MSRGDRSSGLSTIEADLLGRVAVVTGANRGMGKETALALARMGCTVIARRRAAGRRGSGYVSGSLNPKFGATASETLVRAAHEPINGATLGQ